MDERRYTDTVLSIDAIFEYGVSRRDSDGEHQGLGLFVAKQYLKEMGRRLRQGRRGSGAICNQASEGTLRPEGA